MVDNITMVPHNNDFSLLSDRHFAPREGPVFGIPEILGILHRRWHFLVVGCLIGLTLPASYILFTTPLYTSTARILIDTKMNQNLHTQKIIEDTSFDTSLVDSQVKIISSESIVLAVIKSLNLTHDSEFVGSPDAIGRNLVLQVKNFISSVKQYLGLKEVSTDDADTLLERTAVETFLKRLDPKREDLTYVIDIAFTSEDPKKAARIANAVANAYFAANLEAKIKSSKMASKWLQDRLIELKVQATDADKALQNYKSANNIVNTERGLLSQQQLSDANTQLINARAATSEAKARLDRIQQVISDNLPDATVTDALNSSVINRLRAQYLDTSARAADLTSRVGDKHASVIIYHRQMDELLKSIRNEEQRIADAYASDYEIAKAREKSLADNVSYLVGEAGASSQAQVTMRDLESSSETYRNLYDSFLQKFQETIQTQTIPVSDSRVVTWATAPLYKSSPNTVLLLTEGILLGLFLGGGVAVVRELTGDVFRTSNEIEQITGINCAGILPIVAANRRDKTTSIEEFVLDAPHSRFTETLRNLYVKIKAARLERDVKVISVVSAVANEGKTTVAANLGALMVASSGARILIIDGDLHRRSLTAKLAPDADKGLIEALGDPSRLATLVCHRPRTRLDILPCVFTGKRIPNAAELLGSPQMAELLVSARKAYDYIIIELAPIVSVVDVKVIECFIDSFIFVVEWGQTKRSLVLEALSDAKVIRGRLTSIVLNNADPLAIRSIEAYKGAAFRSYYEE
jgi:succinoglycan biosynthesis transport protein ExoP